MSINVATQQHVRRFFDGHPVTAKQWTTGPAREVLPNLQVLEIGPAPRLHRWTYVTVGAWEGNQNNPFEYLMTVDEAGPAYVELLTITAFYGVEHSLGLGHTIPIGRPLVPGSPCEHVYISLPYLFGPNLEVVGLEGREHHVLWLFPITTAEKRLLLEKGLDALEDRLESEKVEYWNPYRESVV